MRGKIIVSGLLDYYDAQGKLRGSADYSGPSEDLVAAGNVIFATRQDDD